ncbi:MAG: ISAs1 family transposase [Oscillochloris sp.]|nr:ISAs1 family transposase [Oscillochloris sp.]
MSQDRPASIAAHFAHLTDPRIARTREHRLLDILTIAICAVVCGAEGPTGMEEFGHAKEAWLRQYLELPNGIPSHDTFGRVLARLDPEELHQGFVSWFAAIRDATNGEVVALDGKTLRGSADRAWGTAAVQVLTAWASSNRLVLGQQKVDPRSNEITAVPALLDKLALAGCIVTLDALHCQVETAKAIRRRQADYVLTVKGNQGDLHQAIHAAFAKAHGQAFANLEHDHDETMEEGHSRWERRTYWTLTDPTVLRRVDPKGRWPDLRCMGMVRAERRVQGQISVEDRLFIRSTDGSAQTFGKAVRGHWGVENSVHWVLDVVWREDDSRMLVGKGPENLAVLRRIALNIVRQDHHSKKSLKMRRFRASLDTDYLLQLLVSAFAIPDGPNYLEPSCLP